MISSLILQHQLTGAAGREEQNSSGLLYVGKSHLQGEAPLRCYQEVRTMLTLFYLLLCTLPLDHLGLGPLCGWGV